MGLLFEAVGVVVCAALVIYGFTIFFQKWINGETDDGGNEFR